MDTYADDLAALVEYLDLRNVIHIGHSTGGGEVTRYVADITKARELLDWAPETPLDDGIPKATAWFTEHRAAHPEEDRAVESEGAGAGWKTLAAAPAV